MTERLRLHSMKALILHSDWRTVWDEATETYAERYPGVLHNLAFLNFC